MPRESEGLEVLASLAVCRAILKDAWGELSQAG